MGTRGVRGVVRRGGHLRRGRTPWGVAHWVAGFALVALGLAVGAGVWLRARAPQTSHVPLAAPAWMDRSDPASVLRAHLDTLLSRECGTQLPRTPSFTAGNGDLCGQTVVTAYELLPGAIGPGQDYQASARLTQLGSDDGSIEPGTILWFYDLRGTPDGWALAGGGTGP